MPKEGFATITVSQEIYEALKVYAEKTNRSIPKAVEHLVNIALQQKTNEEG